MRRSPVLVLALASLLVLTGWAGGGPGQQPVLVPAAPVNAIDAHYQELGGASSFLGAPLGPEYPVAGGAARDYQGGSIYWSSASGAHEVHGAIREHYLVLGGPDGFLGFPLSDELFAVARQPSGAPGKYGEFTGGTIIWSWNTPAYEVHGAIRDRYGLLGGTQGFLGFPLTDETPTPGAAGRYNDFTGAPEVYYGGNVFYYTPGSIYWSQVTGARGPQRDPRPVSSGRWGSRSPGLPGH